MPWYTGYGNTGGGGGSGATQLDELTDISNTPGSAGQVLISNADGSYSFVDNVDVSSVIDDAVNPGDAEAGSTAYSVDKIDALIAAIPTGSGGATISRTASEAISTGQIVSVSDTAMQLADASAGSYKPAAGFVTASVANAATGEVTVAGATFTVDAPVYLGKTPGEVTQDITGYSSGDIIQELGVALSATIFLWQPKAAVALS